MMPSNGGIDTTGSSGNTSGGRGRSSSRALVDHTYRDFSRYLQHAGQVDRHKKVEANFPAKLHQMLSDPHFAHVIVWMPHGRSWKIVDKELLISNIHKYFALKRYHSFVRQLSGWGFKRLHRPGPDHGSYYHECFLRGIPRLTWLMRRVPTNTGKPMPHIEGEPDFYEINKKHPLLPPDCEGHCFSPPHAAGSGTEATKLSTIQEPAATEAALCVYPTSITHMNIHHHQSCWSNYPTCVNHEFLSNATDMALSMSHLHMATAHGNAVHMDAMHAHAGQKTMSTSRELPLSRIDGDGLTPYDEGSEMSSKQQAIQAPSSQTYKSSSERTHPTYFHYDSMPTSTWTTTTSVDQHGTPNYSVLPPPSNNNYQQYPHRDADQVSRDQLRGKEYDGSNEDPPDEFFGAFDF